MRRHRFAHSLPIVLVLLAGATGDARRQVPELMPSKITRETVILAAERLMVARTYPPVPLPPAVTQLTPGMPVDLRILLAAATSSDPRFRREFVVAMGRMEEPTDVPTLLPFLTDPDRSVRDATKQALVQALVNANSDKDPVPITQALDTLHTLYLQERLQRSLDPESAATAEAIGDLPLTDLQAQTVATWFAPNIDTITVPFPTYAYRGMLALARHHGNLVLPAVTLKRLRYLAVLPYHTEPDPREPVLTAFEILSALRDNDPSTIVKAATYHPLCASPIPNCGWEFRRPAVLMMNAALPEYAQALKEAARDASSHVRFAAVQAQGRAISETKTCGPLIDALHDQFPHVVLQAIDLLDPRCDEHDLVVTYVQGWAHELGDSAFNNAWQLRTHALEALAKFAPGQASEIANKTAASHEVWQVRASAAHVALTLKDEALADRLSKDDEPNVRTEALDALGAMRSLKRLPVAVAALDSKDYQLILTAALQLKREALGTVLARQFAATAQTPLMATLKRLTGDDKDTSRDPRVELLGRIGEYGDANDRDFLAELAKYLRDVDPVVASAAADAIKQLTGERPDPQPTRRPIAQPTEDELRIGLKPPPYHLMAARVTMNDGSKFDIGLDSTNAPLTVYRFLQAIEAGYYRGLTFHRVVPDLLVQGGSPGANEYSGTSRFWRDEIFDPHRAGAVALSTRGRHTGDGQFLIELIDIPQFDHRYTVFGGVDVDEGCPPTHLLEGHTISNILAFPPPPPVPVKPCARY